MNRNTLPYFFSKRQFFLAACLAALNLVAADPNDISQLPPTPPWQSHTEGVQRILHMWIDWPDRSDDDVSPDTSGLPHEPVVADHYRKQSYGRTTVISEPLKMVRMTTQLGTMGLIAQMNAVLATLQQQGVNTAQYDRFRIVNMNNQASQGAAYMGSRFLYGGAPVHELAHTYGFHHISGYDIGGWIPACGKVEMGWLHEDDPSGYGYKAHLSGTAEYDLVSEYSMEQAPGKFRAIKLPGTTSAERPIYLSSLSQSGPGFLTISRGGMGQECFAASIAVGEIHTAWQETGGNWSRPTMPMTLGTQVNDAYYIGIRGVKYDTMGWRLSTPAVGGAGVFEYWNGTTWALLPISSGVARPANYSSDDSDSVTNYGLSVFAVPTDWTARTINGEEGYSQGFYYVRYRNTAVGNVGGTLSWVRATKSTTAWGGLLDARYPPYQQPAISGSNSPSIGVQVGGTYVVPMQNLTHTVTVLSQTPWTSTNGARIRVRIASTLTATAPANFQVFHTKVLSVHRIDNNSPGDLSDDTIRVTYRSQGGNAIPQTFVRTNAGVFAGQELRSMPQGILGTDGISTFEYTIPEFQQLASGFTTPITTMKITPLFESISIPATANLSGIGRSTPPTCVLTAPANYSQYQAPATITFQANATDPDGSIAKVTFTITSYNNLTGASAIYLQFEDTTAPYSWTATDLPTLPNTIVYSVQASATDNRGTVGLSGNIFFYILAGNGNQAPTATPQSITCLEDTQQAIILAGTDPEGSTLTYTIASSSIKGTLSGSGANRTYTPTANANGTDSFTFTVSDGTATSNPATVTISITPVNDAPVNTELPIITGTAQVGQTVGATTGTWNDSIDSGSIAGYTYQWQRANDATGNGLTDLATTENYTAVVADLGKFLRVKVTATDAGTPGPGLSSSAFSAWTGAVISSRTLNVTLRNGNAPLISTVSIEQNATTVLHDTGTSHQITGLRVDLPSTVRIDPTAPNINQ